MKNYAIILAGGVGSRVGSAIPKQFLPLKDKPVIVHTILNFQRCEAVEGILVVCLSGWMDYMKAKVEEYNLSKVKWIVEGGSTGYESTRNGIMAFKNILGKDDYIIIHDAARPILPQKAIAEMLRVAYEKGNASLAIPCYETVIYTEDQTSGNKSMDRNSIMRVQTPQTYKYDYLLSLYEKAEKEGKRDFVYANLLVINYGGILYFSKGFTNNIKITTEEDLAFCESLMNFPDEKLFH